MESPRLDVWLDVACLFRTRAEAQRACKGGKVEVNGQRAKPHRALRIGDELVITRSFGRRQRLQISGLADRHIPRGQARELYEDLTPPPSPEDQILRQVARSGRRLAPPGRPDRRDRRRLRSLKEGPG